MEETANPKQTPDIEDVLKTFITRLDSTGLSGVKEVPIHEQSTEISREFAGIVFAMNQIISAGILTQRQGVNLIRQFYEYDTGKTLRVSALETIVMHDKVKKYEASIMPNIMKRFEKNELLRKLQEAEKEEENNHQSDKDDKNDKSEKSEESQNTQSTQD